LKKLIYLFFIFYGTFSFAQQYNFKRYSVSDGLAQSQVYALLEDHEGYIWMGTQGGGLSKYDGKNFQTFTTKDGLSNNYIQALCLDDEGNVFIGTQAGLTIYYGRKFENHPGNIGLKIESITQDSLGIMWLGTNQGLYVFQDDSLQKYLPENTLLKQYTYDVVIDKNNVKWLASDIGLIKIANGKIDVYKNNFGFKSNFLNALFIDAQEKLWVATYGDGVFLFENNKFSPVGLQKKDIIFDFLAVDDNLWMGTLRNGITVLDTKTFSSSNFKEDSGLPGNQVRALIQDSWGNIWVGLSGSGVACYTGQRFEYYSRDNGLPGRQIYAIEQGEESALYLGISDQGLYRFNPTILQKFKHIEGVNQVKVKALFRDNSNRLWVGTDSKGCYLLENDSLIKLNGLSVDWIKCFAEDHQGNIYIGTAGGGINRVTFTDSSYYQVDLITSHDGLNENRITDLVADSLGRVWFATPSNGIGVIFPDKSILTFKQEDGLGSNDVRSLTIDNHQTLWIGSPSSGITTMDLSANELSFSPFEYSHNHVIYFLQFDANDDLWIGTESGLDKVILDNQREAVKTYHYSKPDGFLGVETCTNSSLLDKEGQLWFGTIDGFCKTLAEEKIANTVAPKLKIEQVNLFYKPLQETHLKSYLNAHGQIKDTLVLTYEQNHLTFNFKGIDLINPEKVRYQWILRGQEESWSPFSESQQVSYSNLEPGAYQFTVKSCNKDGVCNPVPEVVNFVILAPFWQKIWFKIAGIGGLIFGFLLIAGLIIRNIRKKSREKNQRLTLEKNVLELEQKALRLQMNPHFIFNSLNSIQGLIAANDNKNARLSLTKFSRLMRLTLENSRKSFISVDQEIAVLTNYLDLEKHTHQNKFDYKIEAEEESLEELIPPLLIQPFVENAVIHGVLPKKDKGLINITFKVKKASLIIHIQDNGIGRSKASEKNQSIQDYHKSTGLDVTRERIENLGQDDGIEFVDLMDEDGRAEGTLVKIQLPLQN